MSNHLLPDMPELWLASKSPRRQDLLRRSGIKFRLLEIDVEEDYPETMDVVEVPEFLARKKAMAAISKIREQEVILAADSVVILDNRIFGKASDEGAALSMIGALAGKQHLVVTGVCICSLHKTISFSDHTQVWIDPMSREEILYYIREYNPFDKAGAYGIQDWIGWTKVSRIEGSYANVMGLPVHRVYDALRQW